MSPATIAFLRRVVLPFNTVLLVVLLIWAIQSGRMPFVSNNPAGSSQAPLSASDFYALNGQPLGADKGSGPGIGKPAPEFTLLDTKGKVVRLSDLRGKTVLLNFWASWCIPCRKEFPELVKAYNGKDDVVVLGVDLQENVGQVEAFAEEFGATFPIVIDTKAEAARAYRVLGLPSSFFIDATGILRAQYFGAMTPSIIAEKLAVARGAAPAGG